jgi:hypothetical protein
MELNTNRKYGLLRRNSVSSGDYLTFLSNISLCPEDKKARISAEAGA